MSKKISYFVYYVINIVFIAAAFFFIKYDIFLKYPLSVANITVLCLLFCLTHIFKFLRLYFILLEENIPSSDLLRIYAKSTFASICLPFKIGEIFKIYLISKRTQHISKGIAAAVIDKFFDAIFLCVVLIPFMVAGIIGVAPVIYVISIFLICVFVLYVNYKSTYEYLNHFFITRKNSKNSLVALRILEKTKHMYDYAYDMVHGRALILATFTIFTWISELGFMLVASNVINMSLGINTVAQYLNNAFFGGGDILLDIYILIGAPCLILVLLITYGEKIWKKL